MRGLQFQPPLLDNGENNDFRKLLTQKNLGLKNHRHIPFGTILVIGKIHAPSFPSYKDFIAMSRATFLEDQSPFPDRNPSNGKKNQGLRSSTSGKPTPPPIAPPQKSILEQFIQGFLQENSIKWMLLIGAAIVTVCSIKLVAQNWEQWNTSIKFFSILAYIGACFGFAEASDRMLHLKSTSATLRGLTLFLLPISFLTMGWMTTQDSISFAAWGATVGVGTLVAGAIGHSILQRFLQRPQWTFEGSYLVLTVLGAIPTSMVASSWLFALAVWLVGTVGIIKVNRHIFWLGEQQKKPFLFGFAPVLLVGAQMLLIYATKLEWQLHREWLGFGLVLCAFPVAATAHSVIEVFRKRSGGLISIWPAPISIPMFLSIAMVFGGILLSTPLLFGEAGSLRMLVPTCALGAVILGWAAKDTRQHAFTYLMLGLIATAYVFSPTWFAELARSLANATAAGLQESKLPYAFYGLTCLPLIGAWVGTAKWLQHQEKARGTNGSQHWIVPLKISSDISSVLLFLVAFTHIKAAFLIPLAYIGLFTVLAIVWKDRRYLIGTLLAATASIVMLVPFANAMFAMSIPPQVATLLGGIWMNVLLLAPIDRWLATIASHPRTIWFWPADSQGNNLPIARSLGMVLLPIVSASLVVMLWTSFQSPFPWYVWPTCGSVLAGTMVLTVQTRSYWAGFYQAVIVGLVLFGIFAQWPVEGIALLRLGTFIPILISLASAFAILGSKLSFSSALEETLNSSEFLEDQYRSATIREAVLAPIRDLATLVSTLVCVGHLVMATGAHFIPLHAMFQETFLSGALCIAWCLVFGCLLRSKSIVVLGSIFFPIALSAFLIQLEVIPNRLDIIPLVWGTSATAYYFLTLGGARGIEAIQRGGWINVQPKFGGTSLRHEGRDGVYGTPGDSVGLSRPSLRSERATPTGRATLIHESETLQSQLFESTARRCANVWLIAVAATAGLTAWPIHVIACLVALGVLYGINRVPFNSPSFGLGCIWGNWVAWCGILMACGVSHTSIPIGEFVFDEHRFLPFLMAGICVNIVAIEWVASKLKNEIGQLWEGILSLLALRVLVECVVSDTLTIELQAITAVSLGLLGINHWRLAVARKDEIRAWIGTGCDAGAVALVGFGLAPWIPISYLHPIGALVIIGFLELADRAEKTEGCQLLTTPNRFAGGLALGAMILSATSACVAPKTYTDVWAITLGVFVTAFYFGFKAYSQRSKPHAWGAMLLINLGIGCWIRSVGFTDISFYLVPLGVSVLALVELMKQQIDKGTQQSLRLVGSLMVLVSPVMQIVMGSWLHMLVLLILSVLVILLAIGLRVRVLMFTGIGFLAADLVGILIRSAVDHPGSLWLIGLSVGVTVIVLAAVCEIYRERILARIRSLTAELATWN